MAKRQRKDRSGGTGASRDPADQGTGIQGWAAQQGRTGAGAPDIRTTPGTGYQDIIAEEEAAADASELPEEEDSGLAGSGLEVSGTLPGSVGGTTGTSGHVAGIQSPGAREPVDFLGQTPEEAERLRREGARRRKEESGG
ncbi:MAG TPA: hypothetical protein VFQ38_22520 [Longimicrobiales bacterium]|nr:hypothetical protein [Longimicrobiales bacterium]